MRNTFPLNSSPPALSYRLLVRVFRIAAASGAKTQWIRSGGSTNGVILEDSRTLASYGFGYSMGPWEVRNADAASAMSSLLSRLCPTNCK